MIRIIGFEGILGDAMISYGAAAVLFDDGTVLNSFTRTRQLRADMEDSEALTTFDRPWEFDENDLADEELVIVAVRRDGMPAYMADLYPDTQRLGGVRAKRQRPHVFFLLRNRSAFDSYADESAEHVADAILREEVKGADALGLLRCALTLSPRNPTLLALRAYLSPDQPAVRTTAVRLLEGADAESRRVFHSVLLACERSAPSATGTPAMYTFTYDDGDQDLGGFDLDDAVKQFHAIDQLHVKMEPTIRRSLPFLAENEPLPRNRLEHFAVGSAEIGLGVLGRNLRERVLRYVELEALARLLRGEIPPELVGDAAFAQDLRRVISPPGGATLKHRPLGSKELEPVVVEIPEEDDRLVDETQFRMLGFVQGFYREVKRAEIRLSPTHMESVSIADDGMGLTPEGAEILRSGGGLFLPSFFALLRRRLVSGRTRWYLQRMAILEASPQRIDTIASSILPKALFSLAQGVEARFEDGAVHVGSSKVQIHGTNIEACREWLEAWQQDVREVELRAADDIDGSEWHSPLGVREGAGITGAMKILIALGLAPQGAAIDELVLLINNTFRSHVRTPSTWRLIRQNGDLFIEGEDDVRLTPLGQRWLQVLRRYLSSMF